MPIPSRFFWRSSRLLWLWMGKKRCNMQLSKTIKFFHFTFLLLRFILDIVLVNFLSQFFFGFCFNSLFFRFLVFMLAFAFYCLAFCCKSKKRKNICLMVLFIFLSVSCSFISLSVVCCSFFSVRKARRTHWKVFSSLKNYPDREWRKRPKRHEEKIC